jgi:hypothetical protein
MWFDVSRMVAIVWFVDSLLVDLQAHPSIRKHAALFNINEAQIAYMHNLLLG